MKKYFTKYYVKLSVIATAIVSLTFAMPAHAMSLGLGFLNAIGLGAILSTLDTIFYFFGYVAGGLVYFGGTLVNWTLDLNAQVLNSSTVQIGWVVSRDLANLGFVLAIILIAFITILRLESYETKKMLWKLIIAALLINFSLVFAGLFIDFSGVLTNFFINKATNYNQSQLGPGLANALKTSQILNQTVDEDKLKNIVTGLWQDPNKHIAFTTSVLFVAGFTILVAISLISLSIMLFMRYIWLTMLLILMPIAWLFWSWPDLSSQWSKWWSEFIRWCFFAPAMSFFIYLALSIAEHQVAGVQGLDAMNLTFADFGQLVGQMISVLGILYGGMYTANNMSITGAGMGIAMVGKAKGYMTGAVGYSAAGAGYLGKRYGLGGLDRLSSNVTGKTINEHLQTATGAFAGIPLAGTVFQNLNARLKKSGAEEVDEWTKHYNSLTDEARENSYDSPVLSPKERAGLMTAMSQNRQMKYMKFEKDGTTPRKDFDRFAQMTVDRGGQASKELISKDPTLAKWKVETTGKSSTQIIQERKEVVGMAIKNMAMEAMDNLDLSIFQTNPEYLAVLKNSHLNKILEKSAGDQQKFVQYISDHIITGNAMPTPPPYLAELMRMKTLIENQPAWVFKVP